MTYPTIELSDDLVVSSIRDIGFALLADGHVLRWLPITGCEGGIVHSGVGEETVKYLNISSDPTYTSRSVELEGLKWL
jgi:hypothetical protein